MTADVGSPTVVGAICTSPAPSSVRAEVVLRVRRVDPPAVDATRAEMRGAVGTAMLAAAVPLSGIAVVADGEPGAALVDSLG